MSTPTPTWQRSTFQPGGGLNACQLFCFSSGPLRADVPMSAARFGLPSPEAMKLVEVRGLTRELDSAWFDGFRSGSLRAIATQALGDVSALDSATQLTAVLISREDAPDLVHLQAGLQRGLGQAAVYLQVFVQEIVADHQHARALETGQQLVQTPWVHYRSPSSLRIWW